MSRSFKQNKTRDSRVCALLVLLQAGDLVPAWRISNVIGVTPRSIYRYVDILRKAGFDIVSCNGSGGGFQLRQQKRRKA